MEQPIKQMLNYLRTNGLKIHEIVMLEDNGFIGLADVYTSERALYKMSLWLNAIKNYAPKYYDSVKNIFEETVKILPDVINLLRKDKGIDVNIYVYLNQLTRQYRSVVNGMDKEMFTNWEHRHPKTETPNTYEELMNITPQNVGRNSGLFISKRDLLRFSEAVVDKEKLEMAARSDDTKQLHQLAQDESTQIRYWVASNKHTEKGTLLLMINKEKDVEVRKAIVESLKRLGLEEYNKRQERKKELLKNQPSKIEDTKTVLDPIKNEQVSVEELKRRRIQRIKDKRQNMGTNTQTTQPQLTYYQPKPYNFVANPESFKEPKEGMVKPDEAGWISPDGKYYPLNQYGQHGYWVLGHYLWLKNQGYDIHLENQKTQLYPSAIRNKLAALGWIRIRRSGRWIIFTTRSPYTAYKSIRKFIADHKMELLGLTIQLTDANEVQRPEYNILVKQLKEELDKVYAKNNKNVKLSNREN